MKRPDLLSGDLFAVPVEPIALAGGFDYGLQVRQHLSEAIKHCQLNSSQVAARMSELMGHDISGNSLHAMTAPSRDQWRFPLECLPAFEIVTETTAITSWLATLRGGRLQMGREVLNAELGRLERMRDEAGRKIKQLKSVMGEES